MSVVRLVRRSIEKPWGRHRLWPGFEDMQKGDATIGEIWFECPPSVAAGDPELLVKFLFTSEKLSVQVHPDDQEARARGQRRGKSEAWQILWAEPGATIGLGLRQAVTRAELRASAEDGTIERLIDWKRVSAGDFLYSPAGTVHAIGPGLVLVEIQQNVDLTYRLYDYGRPRALHLEDGTAVAHPVPLTSIFEPCDLSPGRRLLLSGARFVVERWTAPLVGFLDAAADRPVWLIPLAGQGWLENEVLSQGNVWLVDANTRLVLMQGIDMLVTYAGENANLSLFTHQQPGQA